MQEYQKEKANRQEPKTQYSVLLLEADSSYALTIKQMIESRLPVEVTIVRKVNIARKLLTETPNKFFIGITSVLSVDSSAFEKVDLFVEFDLPIITIVKSYEDDLRDQLIKHHVVDYIVKDNQFDSAYICDLISRIYRNSKLKVLVVDDSKVSRFIVARDLALQKFQVIHAANGLEALQKLKEHGDIHLALVDNQMPKMDGYSFVAKARQHYDKNALSIIGISGSTDPRIAVKFLKAGANDFIAKPFNYEMLLCRVSHNLDMQDAIRSAKTLANTDFLSGLYNRRYFFEQGNKILKTVALKSSDEEPNLTVMIMDIDFFKKINDKYGHDVGDEVIKNFASLLEAHFADDLVARIGGEEFAVISESAKYLTSFDKINAFRLAVADQVIEIKENLLRYTCSIGVTNSIGRDLDEMVVHADKHLYKAKLSGRNQISCSTTS